MRVIAGAFAAALLVACSGTSRTSDAADVGATTAASTSAHETSQSHNGADLQRPPRGKGRIAFASNRDGDFEIFVMRQDGSHVRQLTHNRVDDIHPAWSPDGTRLLFLRLAGDVDPELFLMDRYGSKEKRLTRNRTEDADPTWTPNGRWITYVNAFDGASVYQMTSDQSRTRAIVLEKDNSYMENPSWAPGGRRLVYTYEVALLYRAVCCSGKGRHGVVYADKSILHGPYSDIQRTSWSPDGEWILFSARKKPDGGRHDLFMTRPGGQEVRSLLEDKWDSRAGDWGGSNHYTFESNRHGSYDIFVSSRDGSYRRRLTRWPSSDEIQANWWKPDPQA
jgi:TolB protein